MPIYFVKEINMEEKVFTSKELRELILETEHNFFTQLEDDMYGDYAAQNICYYAGANDFVKRILSVIGV